MDHLRHSGIFSAKNLAVTLIGAGGIGAITAATLAKMGIPYLAIADDDKVEPVNLPTQFHPIVYDGSYKVDSAMYLVEMFSDETRVERIFDRIGPDTDPNLLTNPIIISAVDSISARKAIWTAVRRSNWQWYLDARMGAETFSLYSVNSKNCLWYNDFLNGQDDSKIADLPCTSKATIYCGCGAAAYIGAAVRKIATGETLPHVLTVDFYQNTILTV